MAERSPPSPPSSLDRPHVHCAADERERPAAIGFDAAQLLPSRSGGSCTDSRRHPLGLVAQRSLSGVFPTGSCDASSPRRATFRTTPLILGAGCGRPLTLWTLPHCCSRGGHRAEPVTVGGVEAIATGARFDGSDGLRFAFTRRERDGGSMRTVVIGCCSRWAPLPHHIPDELGPTRERAGAIRTNYDLPFRNGSESVPPELARGSR